MAAEFAIREIEPAASDQILELVRLGLGAGSVPRTPEFWNWKHVDNPFGPSYALAAEADGRLVGLRMFLRWRFRCGDREVPAVRAVDTVTHPEWQGRGIFTRLTLAMVERVAKDGVAFVFNTPNERSRAGYLKMGWQDVGRVPVLVKPLRPLRMLFGGNAREADEQCLDGFDSVEEVLAACDPGATGTDPDCRLMTPKTPRYLRWRYAAEEGRRYAAVCGRRGEHWALLVVGAGRRRGRCELRIEEALSGPEARSSDLVRQLLDAAGATPGVDYLVRTGNGSRPPRFLTVPGLGPRFTVRPLAATAPTSWSGWLLSIGDLEVF